MNEYYLGFAVSDAFPKDKKTTATCFIQWNEFDEDTIKCDLWYAQNALGIKKVFINQRVVWDVEVDPFQDRVFTLIK